MQSHVQLTSQSRVNGEHSTIFLCISFFSSFLLLLLLFFSHLFVTIHFSFITIMSVLLPVIFSFFYFLLYICPLPLSLSFTLFFIIFCYQSVSFSLFKYVFLLFLPVSVSSFSLPPSLHPALLSSAFHLTPLYFFCRFHQLLLQLHIPTGDVESGSLGAISRSRFKIIQVTDLLRSYPFSLFKTSSNVIKEHGTNTTTIDTTTDTNCLGQSFSLVRFYYYPVPNPYNPLSIFLLLLLVIRKSKRYRNQKPRRNATALNTAGLRCTFETAREESK